MGPDVTPPYMFCAALLIAAYADAYAVLICYNMLLLRHGYCLMALLMPAFSGAAARQRYVTPDTCDAP